MNQFKTFVMFFGFITSMNLSIYFFIKYHKRINPNYQYELEEIKSKLNNYMIQLKDIEEVLQEMEASKL